MYLRSRPFALVLATVLLTAACGAPTTGVARGVAPVSVRAGEIDREALAARARRTRSAILQLWCLTDRDDLG